MTLTRIGPNEIRGKPFRDVNNHSVVEQNSLRKTSLLSSLKPKTFEVLIYQNRFW